MDISLKKPSKAVDIKLKLTNARRWILLRLKNNLHKAVDISLKITHARRWTLA
jgi:hypothetical protein